MVRTLVFLGTGGTIAGKAASAQDNVGYTAAQLGVAQLLAGVPGLQRAVDGCTVEHEQVAQLDSKDMEHAVWSRLTQRIQAHLLRDEVRAVLVTHGTDTLEETAFFLSQVLPANLLEAKPVVLTCAMRPATALTPDGPQNVLDAVRVALDARACGVVAVCAGTIHAARYVQKSHPYRLDAFESSDGGALGYVEEGCVRWVRECPVEGGDASLPGLDQPGGWPRVEVVFSHAGASGATVRALISSATPGEQAVRGLVVAGTGNGTVHRDIEAALGLAQQRGIHVVRTTRCAYGAVVPGAVSPLAVGKGLPPFKERIALMLQIMRG